MVFYCRTARGAAAAFAPQGSFLSLANTHPALRKGLVYELPQHTLVLARLPSVAHILKESRVILAVGTLKMPPKADGCEDSTTWHKNGDESKDCAWVAEWSPRCQVKGADKSLASEHCTCACQ